MDMLIRFIKYYVMLFIPKYLIVGIIRRFSIGSYENRLGLGAVHRPHYGYCVLNAAKLAKKLNYDRISVVEFGVAGGNGLLNLEFHALEIEKLLDIKIDVYGFDTGEGLPTTLDYRDLPYHWKPGFFKMDVPLLQSKLKKAKLIIGNIDETSKTFFDDNNPAPIAAMFHDFDYYSSTEKALKMLDMDDKHFLPRIYCYLDDIIGTEIELYNDYTGERLAINEFNASHTFKKFSPAYHLITQNNSEAWHHQIFIYHNLHHSRYNDFVSTENQQLHAGLTKN
jgi:hypothetical protein